MDSPDTRDISRVRKEVEDAFVHLREELDPAKETLHTRAILAEESLGLLGEFEELKRRCEDLLERESYKSRSRVPPPPLPGGAVRPQPL
jgi:hypothetical protein